MLFSKEKMRYVTLNDSELRLAKYALLRFRNMLIAKELPTEDVNALLLKLYKQANAPLLLTATNALLPHSKNVTCSLL